MSPLFFERQIYESLDYPLAEMPIGARFDFFQPKYDGCWARVEHKAFEDYAILWSRTNRVLAHLAVPVTLKDLEFIAIGEYMAKQERTVGASDEGAIRLFDLLYLPTFPRLDSMPYKVRFSLLSKKFEGTSEKWLMTPCLPMQALETIWENYVKTRMLEGVVFRSWDSPYSETLYRCKLEETLDAVIKGFKPGTPGSKYEHTLGSLTLGVSDNDEFSFDCSGMTDFQRHRIWQDRETLVGQVVEVQCSGRFKSGCPRHPRFLRFRHDKQASEVKLSDFLDVN